MSDKRRRYRKPKEEKRPIILAKREDDRSNDGQQQEMQPKLLLKTKADKEYARQEMAAHNGESTNTQLQKTIIVTRSDLNGSVTTTTKDQAENNGGGGNSQLAEPVTLMSRPATVISSTGIINANVRKLLSRTNTDFLVVGVVGLQGVGKSTIMNLLANELPDYDYYTKVFVEEDTIFPIKLKQHKCFSRSRTESTHMYITSDRLILLDSPPVLCNSYKKDMTSNELDDLRTIITFLTVCHILIVLQDDYMNMNFVRLLHFAELMKPATHDPKLFSSDYMPRIIYVKNRAKREDYAGNTRARQDLLLKAFLEDSRLRVNSCFLFPEVRGPSATAYHNSLEEIVDDLRTTVLMTQRDSICNSPNELTETLWFDLLTKISQDMKHFFFKTYEEVHRTHLEVNVQGSTNNNSAVVNSKDNEVYENWRS